MYFSQTAADGDLISVPVYTRGTWDIQQQAGCTINITNVTKYQQQRRRSVTAQML